MNVAAIIMARLGLDSRDFRAGLQDATNNVSSFSSKLLGIPSLGSVLTTAGIAAAFREITEWASHIQDVSDRYKVNTEIIQRWTDAGEKMGVGIDDIAVGFRKLEVSQDGALQGNAELLNHFMRLGISVEDLRTLKPEEIMTKIGSGAMNASDMVAVLGKKAIDLRPLLEGIADGTVKFGDALSAVDIKKLDEADDKLKALWQTVRNFTVENLISGTERVGYGMKAIGMDIAGVTERLWELSKAFVTFDKERLVELDKTSPFKGYEMLQQLNKPQLGPSLEEMGASPEQQKKDFEGVEADKKRQQSLDEQLRKQQNISQVLKLQESGEQALAGAVKTNLDFKEKLRDVEEQIKTAKAAGKQEEVETLMATQKELETQRQLTLEMNAQAISRANLERLQSSLDTLAAIPEGGAEGVSAGYSPRMLYAAHRARQAQHEQEQADYLAKYKGDYEGAQMHINRAEDIKAGTDQLKGSEKDLSGAVRLGIDESEIMQKIEENTAAAKTVG